MDDSQSAELLTDLGQRMLSFLEGISEQIVDPVDIDAFRRALGEVNRIHLMGLNSDLRGLSGSERLTEVGLAGAQLKMKVRLALSGIERAERMPFASPGWKNYALEALGRVKVVLVSLRVLSPWAEALIGFVGISEKLLEAR